MLRSEVGLQFPGEGGTFLPLMQLESKHSLWAVSHLSFTSLFACGWP